MISKLIISIGSIALMQSLFAGCLTRENQTIGKPFETYSFCKNTLSVPQYTLSGYSSVRKNSSDYLMLFSFDPQGVSVICKDFSIDGHDDSKCQAFRKTLKGSIQIPEKYKGTNSTVYMYNFQNESDYNKLSKVANDKNLSFSTNKNIDEAKNIGCYAAVNVNKKEIFLGYLPNDFYKLAYCIQDMEEWISSDIGIVKKLIQ